MRILFLAPQPFFQERGTPIAVRLALNVLSTNPNLQIDLLSYGVGTDLAINNVRHFRSRSFNKIANIGAGISLKKLVHDFLFFIKIIDLIFIKREKYDLIHAVEESVFFAWLIKKICNIPYIYDMDSSIAMQLVEKWFLLKPLAPICNFLERHAVRGSIAVVPVCDALEVLAKNHGAKHTQILRDISLLEDSETKIDLRLEANIKSSLPILLYIGNLEAYQGIDLLIEAFEIADPLAELVIIGGSKEHLNSYQEKIINFKTKSKIHFIGSRPLANLKAYLTQAEILVSPRTLGNNTPMKIYSYLHSGKAILATDLPTHNQVLNSNVAFLVKPISNDFANAITELVQNPELCNKLGQQAFELAEANYTFDIFKLNLLNLYKKIEQELVL